MSVRVRFAPSPTGLLHIGNVRAALFSWLFARRHGGTFVLRIEDTDQARYDPRAEDYIGEALHWLGLEWDEGPGIGGPFAPYRQSERLALYRRAADTLVESGHAYRCYCTKERIDSIREVRKQANIHPYGYDRHCRGLSANERTRLHESGEPRVVRFAVPLEGQTAWDDAVRGRITYQNRELDDHVLLKSDGFPTYQLANVVDDHWMEITHVLRGDDWIPSTPRHVLEYDALGWIPPVFGHLPQINGPDGKKLSKRHGDDAALSFREAGYLPEALFNFLALLGWSPGDDREVLGRDELIAAFDVARVTTHPAVFDRAKLDWMNGLYIRQLPVDELASRAIPFLQEAGVLPTPVPSDDLPFVTSVVALEQEKLKRLDEAAPLLEFFFTDPPAYEPAAVAKWLNSPAATPVLDAVSRRLSEIDEWAHDGLEGAIRSAAEELGVRASDVIHPVRVAVTGRTVGPGLYETLAALGRERVLRRIAHARSEFCPA